MDITKHMKIKAIFDILKESGYKDITMKAIKSDIAEGAPVNPDGSMSLIDYGAWLARFV